jgi:hypothetical protein
MKKKTTKKEVEEMAKVVLRFIKGETIPLGSIRKFIKENTIQYEREQKAEGVSTNTEWDRGYNACLENLQGTFIGE